MEFDSLRAPRRVGRTALEQNALVIYLFFETKRQVLNWASNPYFMLVRVSPPDSGRNRFPARRKSPEFSPQDFRQQPMAPAQKA